MKLDFLHSRDRKANNEMEDESIIKLPHHVQENICSTRPVYRQGKKYTAVKVYTISDESQHVIVSGVPKLNLKQELKNKCSCYGIIKKLHVMPNYECEDFTEAFHVHYSKIQSARILKRLLDGFNFYGGVLHICYAPELESVSETKQKLLQRLKYTDFKIKINSKEKTIE